MFIVVLALLPLYAVGAENGVLIDERVKQVPTTTVLKVVSALSAALAGIHALVFALGLMIIISAIAELLCEALEAFVLWRSSLVALEPTCVRSLAARRALVYRAHSLATAAAREVKVHRVPRHALDELHGDALGLEPHRLELRLGAFHVTSFRHRVVPAKERARAGERWVEGLGQ